MRSGGAGSFPIICPFAASKRKAPMDFFDSQRSLCTVSVQYVFAFQYTLLESCPISKQLDVA